MIWIRADLIHVDLDQEKGVHGDYTKELLQTILQHWAEAMGTNNAGEQFTPRLGITDNDIRERHALATIWPGISLLLCMYHIWQAWRLALTRSLAGTPKGNAMIGDPDCACQILHAVDITMFPEAVAAYTKEYSAYKKLARDQAPVRKLQAEGAIKFLTYLSTFLATKKYWLQWSCGGSVIKAAELLDIPEDQIPCTTNHLESHNNQVKNNYFSHHEHGGHLPHVDVWILTLVLQLNSNVPIFELHQRLAWLISGNFDFLEQMFHEPNSESVQDSSSLPKSPSLDDNKSDNWLNTSDRALNSDEIAVVLGNEQAILMQELFLLVDHTTKLLRQLSGLGVPNTTLEPFVCPYNCVFLASTPPSTASGLCLSITTGSKPTSEPSSPSGFPRKRTVSIIKEADLVPFDWHHKEHQKESHVQR
ncbi:hypothetical protein C8Q76DRAFT_698787 [Earliella scabrosa]|nr:hypothetical protein C8Q76DRAFT_698787 [Earliella scabrosa]